MKRLLLSGLMGLTLIGQAQAAQQITLANAKDVCIGLALAATPLVLRGLIATIDCNILESELKISQKKLTLDYFNPLKDPQDMRGVAQDKLQQFQFLERADVGKINNVTQRVNILNLLAGFTSILFLGASTAKLVDWPKLISNCMSTSTGMNVGIAAGSALSLALVASATNFELLLGS